jgi:putative hydrolase of the HAD superfamily
MAPPVRALSFDLWDTIVDDDSDEPKRKALGLRPKAEERRHLIWQALDAEQPIAREAVSLAYAVADAAFDNVWKKHSVTWTLDERLDVILLGLARRLSGQARAAVVEALARMEVDTPPDVIPGIEAALAELARRYKLCVVSDAIVTPGVRLRELLERHGLKRHFQGFAFSDEVGRSKPHPAMFAAAARQLGVGFEEMLHVGDRELNDVKGPKALGMRAVLFTQKRKPDGGGTSADAACGSARELPAVIDGIAAQARA